MNNQSIAWDELLPAMTEVAGGLVLEDLALQRELDKELAANSITVTQADIAAEREGLTLTIATEAGLSPDAAAITVNRLRARRGLGPVRFEQQIASTAKLRALAKAELVARDEEFKAHVRAEFGARVTARIITAPTTQAAADIRQRLQFYAGDPRALRVAFATEAFTSSTDVSAARGGLLVNILPEDPTLPAELHETLRSQRIDELGPVVAVSGMAAIVLVESRAVATKPSPDEQARAEAKVRQRMERSSMDAIARTLLARADITILSPGLKWSWDARPEK